MAVPYAVSKRLIEYVRIRHDWGAMYIVLKGEDKQFYVDIRVIIVYILFLIVMFFWLYFLYGDY